MTMGHCNGNERTSGPPIIGQMRKPTAPAAVCLLIPDSINSCPSRPGPALKDRRDELCFLRNRDHSFLALSLLNAAAETGLWVRSVVTVRHEDTPIKLTAFKGLKTKALGWPSQLSIPLLVLVKVSISTSMRQPRAGLRTPHGARVRVSLPLSLHLPFSHLLHSSTFSLFLSLSRL